MSELYVYGIRFGKYLVTDLTDWLTAQIDADEAAVRMAGWGRREWEWRYPGGIQKEADGLWAHNRSAPGLNQNEIQLWSDRSGRMDRHTADHIARWDPARVLAECAAKRQIVQLHQPTTHPVLPPECEWCGPNTALDLDAQWPCLHLKVLAAPYASALGYQPEWAPQTQETR